DPLVEIPAERTDGADVVVVPHVAVGDDVESGIFLFANHGRDGVVVGLFVLDFLERDADIAAEQLMLVPVWPWVGSDHRGRQKLVYDLRCHVAPLLCWRIVRGRHTMRPTMLEHPGSCPSTTLRAA